LRALRLTLATEGRQGTLMATAQVKRFAAAAAAVTEVVGDSLQHDAALYCTLTVDQFFAPRLYDNERGVGHLPVRCRL